MFEYEKFLVILHPEIMILIKNDIELSKTEEAEETNVPVAKLVKASPFQGDIAGSSPVRDTNNFIGWNATADWSVEKCNNGDFNIKYTDRQVAGITTTRLSVLKT